MFGCNSQGRGFIFPGMKLCMSLLQIGDGQPQVALRGGQRADTSGLRGFGQSWERLGKTGRGLTELTKGVFVSFVSRYPATSGSLTSGSLGSLRRRERSGVE